MDGDNFFTTKIGEKKVITEIWVITEISEFLLLGSP
jgi:hypothetical protein